MNLRKEPVYAFRATSVKDSGTSNEQYINKNPGKVFNLYPNMIMAYKCNGAIEIKPKPDQKSFPQFFKISVSSRSLANMSDIFWIEFIIYKKEN